MLDHEHIIQWFNAVQDLNPAYLTAEDGLLAIKLMKQLGQRVPDSVWKLAYPDGVPTAVHTGWEVHKNGSISRRYEVELRDPPKEGESPGAPTVTKAYSIADQVMFEQLIAHAIGGREGCYCFPNADDSDYDVVQEAFTWLSPRGFVMMDRDEHGDFIRVIREPGSAGTRGVDSPRPMDQVPCEPHPLEHRPNVPGVHPSHRLLIPNVTETRNECTHEGGAGRSRRATATDRG